MRTYSYNEGGMLQGHKEQLRTRYEYIIEQCQSSVTPICNHLFSRGILSFYQKEIILSQSIDHK